MNEDREKSYDMKDKDKKEVCERKVDRVLANQDMNSTASLLTSNIPFAWFPCDEM